MAETFVPRNRDFAFPTCSESTTDNPDTLCPLAQAHLGLMQENAYLKEEIRRLQQRLMTDEGTGVYNRVGLEHMGIKSLYDALRTGKPLTLAYLDLDHFKSVNDEYGHEVGDKVLKAIAEQLITGVRKNDVVARDAEEENDVVARNGGEEFVILLKASNLDSSVNVIERLRQNLVKVTLLDDGKAIALPTLSIGLAEFNPEDYDRTNTKDSALQGYLDKLKAEADRAMYEAKHNGRNRVYCSTKEGILPASPQIELPLSTASYTSGV